MPKCKLICLYLQVLYQIRRNLSIPTERIRNQKGIPRGLNTDFKGEMLRFCIADVKIRMLR